MEDCKCNPNLNKKCKTCDAGNYRPVRLTSHVCTILESTIKHSIINRITANNLLYECQRGFINKRFCMINLLQFIEAVTGYLDQGCQANVIFLDFQTEFDQVPHGRLLLKVKSIGIRNLVANWIE